MRGTSRPRSARDWPQREEKTMKIQGERLFMETNGVRLHVVAAGPADGPLVVLLHGFPDFWYGWRKQIGPLAAAGYRVLAPDQRGYNRSDKPPGIRAYVATLLAEDIAGLITAAGRERAALVGHDWGAGVAWGLTLLHPERVARLTVLNVGHPAVMEDHLRHDPAQQRRSWYILAFQLPRLPEAVFLAGGARSSAAALRASARPGAFSAADMARYRRAWLRPGAMTAMINWYRAVVRATPPRPADQRVHIPTLIIWGAQDPYLVRALAPESAGWCDDARVEMIEEATHWVHTEEPERVNRLLLDFLAPLRDDPGARPGPAA
jgi:epoxide hydrolase 4